MVNSRLFYPFGISSTKGPIWDINEIHSHDMYTCRNAKIGSQLMGNL